MDDPVQMAIAKCITSFLFHSNFRLLCVEYVILKALDELPLLMLVFWFTGYIRL